MGGRGIVCAPLDSSIRRDIRTPRRRPYPSLCTCPSRLTLTDEPPSLRAPIAVLFLALRTLPRAAGLSPAVALGRFSRRTLTIYMPTELHIV
jgi:hypothetical protein